MSKMSLAFSALMTLAMVLFIAPSIIAMNRGKLLRNIALWLAVFAALGLVYKNFGPGRSVTETSLGVSSTTDAPGIVLDGTRKEETKKKDNKKDDAPDDDQGFNPPQE